MSLGDIEKVDLYLTILDEVTTRRTERVEKKGQSQLNDPALV